MTSSRNITTWYEDALGVERDLTVTVRADGLRDIATESDLPDMPEAALEALTARMAYLYWAAERHAYWRDLCLAEDAGERQDDQ